MAAKAARPKRPFLTPDQARAIYAYNFRLFDRYVRAVKRLPGRAAFKRREIGHQSLFDTLVHILNAQEVWLTYIVAGRDSDADLRPLFKDAGRHPKEWKGFARYERRVHHGIESYLAGLTPREMRRSVHAFWMPGEYTVSDAILQTTFEEAHHVGEIIGALWQDDIASPEMTWIGVGRALTRRRP
ncbi:MAG: DinB family protein [Thermoplasmata archaeon]